MRFVHSTALIHGEHLRHSHGRHLHLQRPHPRQQSLRRVRSILEMVGVGVTMAAFLAVALF